MTEDHISRRDVIQLLREHYHSIPIPTFVSLINEISQLWKNVKENPMKPDLIKRSDALDTVRKALGLSDVADKLTSRINDLDSQEELTYLPGGIQFTTVDGSTFDTLKEAIAHNTEVTHQEAKSFLMRMFLSIDGVSNLMAGALAQRVLDNAVQIHESLERYIEARR